MTTKPKGRPAKPDMRTYQVRMTEAQHAEFKRLGGSAWLQKRIDGIDIVQPTWAINPMRVTFRK